MAKVESRQLTEKIKAGRCGGIIGRAPDMDRRYRIISKAAQSAHLVLILGESGIGKELVACGDPTIPVHSETSLSSPWTADP